VFKSLQITHQKNCNYMHVYTQSNCKWNTCHIATTSKKNAITTCHLLLSIYRSRILQWKTVRSTWSAMAAMCHSSSLSHPVFKAKTRCSSYVCPGSSCHIYGQNVSTEYQCLYYIVSYYKHLLQVQKGLNSGMDTILPQAVDRGFRTPRRNLHPRTPYLLRSRT
jgi:hypothetical protein